MCVCVWTFSLIIYPEAKSSLSPLASLTLGTVISYTLSLPLHASTHPQDGGPSALIQMRRCSQLWVPWGALSGDAEWHRTSQAAAMEPPCSHKPWCDDKTVWSHLKDTDLTISSMMLKFTIFWNELSLNSHVIQYGGKSYFTRHRLHFSYVAYTHCKSNHP